MDTTKVSVRGQIVIPKKLLDEMKLVEGDLLEVSTKGKLIIFKKIENQINGDELKEL